MRVAVFNIGTGRSEGEIVRVNDQTIIVKLRRAGKTVNIKRHIAKHRVEFLEGD